jgi:hypothetical protein
MIVTVAQIAELICAVYHEARNVRDPVRLGMVDERTRYAALLGLSTQPRAAWREMSGIRSAAGKANSADMAGEIFTRRFRLTLAELVELYQQPCWSDLPTGGPTWAKIAVKLWELVGIHALGDEPRSAQLYCRLLEMPIGSGRLVDRLKSLQS